MYLQAETIDNIWAAVSAREDFDGIKRVVFTPDRSVDDEGNRVEIDMTPQEARQLARALNKAARRLSL